MYTFLFFTVEKAVKVLFTPNDHFFSNLLRGVAEDPNETTTLKFCPKNILSKGIIAFVSQV